MDSALRDLEQLGLTKDEISNLIEPSPELQKTTEPTPENPASNDVESTAKALDEKKKSLDEKAKKLGYVGIKQFNAQNQLNEN